MYTYSGDSINCTIAEGVNSAASAVVGVGTNRMMLSVGESLELGSRVLRQLRARGRVITETILANDAIDMDQIAKDVDDSVDDGSLREQLDEKAPAVTFSGGNDDEIESMSVTTGTITTPRSEDQIPSPSASPATDPTPSASTSTIASQTPTATATATSTPTPTASPIPSATSSPSTTPSPTPSASSTPTASASITPTPSATSTSSATPTQSTTATPSATSSASPSVSPTPSGTSTATATPTASSTSTPSPSPTPLTAPTPTPSQSPAPSASPSPSPSSQPAVLILETVPGVGQGTTIGNDFFQDFPVAGNVTWISKLQDNSQEFFTWDGVAVHQPAQISSWGWSHISYAVASGNCVYFQGQSPTLGSELFYVEAGSFGSDPVLAHEGIVGTNSGAPNYIYVFGNKLVYGMATATGMSRHEPYVHNLGDGTNSLMAEIYTGSSGSIPQSFTECNSKLFFEARSGTSFYEVWEWDGTNAPTEHEVRIGEGGSNPDNFWCLESTNTLYFAASTADGIEPWKLGPSDSSPSMLIDYVSGTGSSQPFIFGEYGGSIIMALTDATNGRELFLVNPTSVAATLLADINPGPGASSPSNIIIRDDSLFCSASITAGNTEIFEIDLTTGIPILYRELYPGSTAGARGSHAVFGDWLMMAMQVEDEQGASTGSEYGVIAASSTTVNEAVWQTQKLGTKHPVSWGTHKLRSLGTFD